MTIINEIIFIWLHGIAPVRIFSIPFLIIGGREVYSQSRARSGRHKHGKQQQHRYSVESSSQQSYRLEGTNVFQGETTDITAPPTATHKDIAALKANTLRQAQPNEQQSYRKSTGYLYDNTTHHIQVSPQTTNNEAQRHQEARYPSLQGNNIHSETIAQQIPEQQQIPEY